MPEGIILVVDDEECICELMRSILGSSGYTVIAAKDGYEALKKALEQKPDLIMMDLLMPSMNGVNAIRALKLCQPDIPVVILTGLQDDPIIEEGINAGAEMAIFKPITIRQVTECISKLLGQGQPESCS